MRLLLVFLGLLVVLSPVADAAANGNLRDLWRDAYNAGTGGVCPKLSTASVDCSLCHTSGAPDLDDLNPYATDVQTAKQSTILWSAAFMDVEGDDSDGDGVSNINEINNCGLPGDASDTPSVPNGGYSLSELKILFGK